MWIAISIVLVLWLLVDLLQGTSSMAAGVRWIWRGMRREIEIETPPDLVVAAANGLVSAGSEVVVGDHHESDEKGITRFAILPGGEFVQVGLVFRIVSINSKRLVLRREG